MRATTEDFQTAMRASHAIDAKVDLYFPATGGGSVTISRNGVLTPGSDKITGLSSTADLLPGFEVAGTGIAGIVSVASVDNPTQVTISAPYPSSAPVTYRCSQNSSHGDTPGGNTITSETTPSGVVAGMAVTGPLNTNGNPLIRPGTTVAGVSGNKITLSQNTYLETFWDGGSPAGTAAISFAPAAVTKALTFTGTIAGEDALPVTVQPASGTITIDRTAQIRRTGSVVIPWSLERANELGLDVRTLPLGGWCVPYRGIRYPDGSSELVKLGYMRVESVTWSTREELATLELADRMAQMRDEPFQAPYSASGLRVANAAKAIVQAVFPDVVTDVRYDPSVTLADVVYSGTRVDALFELARAVGGETYFDCDGHWIFDVTAGGKAVNRTGTLTDEGTAITGLAQTSDLSVGMTVTGVGIPPLRKIVAIVSSSQVTLNAPANIYGQKNCRLDNGSQRLTDVTDTDDLSPGMAISGTGIPAGTKILALSPAEILMDKAATSGGYPLLTFTAPNPAALSFAGAGIAYPVWAVDAGDDGVLIDAGESLSRSGVYNGVLVTGQATGVTAAFSVLVVDSDSASPTRWGGPFGKVLRIENSNAVQNVTQGNLMAEALLAEGLGLTRSLTIAAAPMPALEAGDTVRVVFGDGRDETHLLEAVQHDIGPGQMSLATHAVESPASALWAPLNARRAYYTGPDVWREIRGATVAERVRQRSPRRLREVAA